MKGEYEMRNITWVLIFSALISFVLSTVFKIGFVHVGPVLASTLQKLTTTLLLFAIALSLVDKK